MPLTPAPGQAQADFGEAWVIIAGVKCKADYFAMDLPQSDDCFVAVFPAETTEAFLEGHVRVFAYFERVPRQILYDFVPGNKIVVMWHSALCVRNRRGDPSGLVSVRLKAT
ncbi:MAG TPA: hypothetical protein VMU57_17425 [Edaphobacter sp.]|nr:hypothetical protein [Edaphobacter sp.]HUZ96686.1 hypothetical protein [Edaphobacter sp.]